VVLCQLGIDDIAQYFLAKANILAVERVEKKDIEKVARATGANLITSVDDFDESDIGSAGLVEIRGKSEEKMIYITTAAIQEQYQYSSAAGLNTRWTAQNALLKMH